MGASRRLGGAGGSSHRAFIAGSFASQEETFPLLLRHREVRQPAGAAAVPVPDHAGSDPAARGSPDASLRSGKAEGFAAWFPCVFTWRRRAVASSPTQICVGECPDRYLTYLSAYGSRTPAELEYYRQFCVPEFHDLQKVGRSERGGGVRTPAPATPAFPGTPEALTSSSPVPIQAPIEVLKDKECPAMIIPSTPRTSGGLTSCEG